MKKSNKEFFNFDKPVYVGEQDGVIFFSEINEYQLPVLFEKKDLEKLIDGLKSHLEKYDTVSSDISKTRLEIIKEKEFAFNSKKEELVENIEPKQKGGFIYIVKCTRSNLFKIGSTSKSSPNKRISQLRVSNPSITLINYFKVISLSDEFFWHKKFQNKRVDGEWFNLSSGDILLIEKHYTQ